MCKHIYVCAYLYMHTYMYKMHICMYVYKHTYIHTNKYICMHTYIYVCMYVCMTCTDIKSIRLIGWVWKCQQQQKHTQLCIFCSCTFFPSNPSYQPYNFFIPELHNYNTIYVLFRNAIQFISITNIFVPLCNFSR